MSRSFFLICAIGIVPFLAKAQPCTPAGDETTYGTNNQWIGYVYSGQNFNTYIGYVNEGTVADPTFDESFGGDNVTYNTNGCSINTNNFSVRYKLTKNFAAGNYSFTVGGDDGYRFSLDGGATWVINKWVDQGYGNTTYDVSFPGGNVNMVLEFYENGGQNRVTFSVASVCSGSVNTDTTFGANNIWIGHVYSGTNFNFFKGNISVGTAPNMDFDIDFGGDYATFNTNSCAIYAENFSVRFNLRKTFLPGIYTFVIGADDGYRFSIDSGATWVVTNWTAHSYTSTNTTLTLSGTYNLVFEYYEANVNNRVSFLTASAMLPVKITSFTAFAKSEHTTQINWTTEEESNIRNYIVEKSEDGSTFTEIGSVAPNANRTANKYGFAYQHAEVFTKIEYFRLKTLDKDGSIKYTPVAIIQPSTKSLDIAVFPNPMTGQDFYWNADKNRSQVTVKIFSMEGQLLQTKTYPKIQKGELIRETLRSAQTGLYRINLSDEDGVFANKIVLKK